MLKYNFQRFFAMKGIYKPAPFLQSKGFKGNSAYRMIHGKKNVYSPKEIEKLCVIFECTPNDLMEWTPDENYDISENHPLRKLTHQIVIDLRNIADDIPGYDIPGFAKEVEELKKKYLKK